MVRGPVRRIGEEITELFAHPGGWAARPMKHALNFFNGRSNRRVAEVLAVCPGDRVLEVGFGGGAAIPTTLRTLDGKGWLCGVDLSTDMAVLAHQTFSASVDARMLALTSGDVAALPLRGEAFDCAYAVHSHLYWPSPLAGVQEIGRVLRPGGRILLAMDVVSGIRLIQRFAPRYEPLGPDGVVEVLESAGFGDITTQRLSRGVFGVLGTRA